MTSVSVMHNNGDWDKISRKEVKDNVVIPFFRGLNLKLEEVNVYLMDKSNKKYGTSIRNLNIFISASPGEYTKQDAVIEAQGSTFALEMFVPNDLTGITIILDEKNQVFGYYIQNAEELYVPYNLAILEQADFEKFILQLLSAFKVEVLDEIVNRDSWVKGKDKTVLAERIKARVGSDSEREMRSFLEREESLKRYIREYTQSLKQKHDEYSKVLRDIAKLEDSKGDEALENFLAGLDLIAGHPQVSNIIVEKKQIIIYIDKVYARARVNGKTRRYYIGNMHVKIDILNTDVKFFGDNGRRGLWTEKDPHPHVNGRDGVACLGNVASTIAELCSQKEIYPLFLICLDYLENANTEDSAGRKITAWDEVDDEGNIIERVVECPCGRCGEEIAGDSYAVYTAFSDGDLSGEQEWCEDCRGNYATHSDDAEETVSDSIYDDVYNHYNDEEDEE